MKDEMKKNYNERGAASIETNFLLFCCKRKQTESLRQKIHKSSTIIEGKRRTNRMKLFLNTLKFIVE